MEIQMFSDLIDAIGKVFAGIKVIADLSKAEKEKYRQTFDETYLLMDSALNMVILRLGDILQKEDDAEFLAETARLEYYDDWIKTEREFRLCRSLRVAARETETLSDKLMGKISAKDWDTLLQIMQTTLAAEGDMAGYIANQFHDLASSAGLSGSSQPEVQLMREKVASFRIALLAERQKLIQLESDLLSFAI